MFKKTTDKTHSTNIKNISFTFTYSNSKDKKKLYYYIAYSNKLNNNNKRIQKKFYISQFNSKQIALSNAKQWLIDNLAY